MTRSSLLAQLLLAISLVSLTACETPPAGPAATGTSVGGAPGTNANGTDRSQESLTRAEPAQAQIAGAANDEAIHAFIRDHVHEIQGCYEAALPSAPELEGIVTIEFAIDIEGAVVGANAPRGEAFGQDRVVACMLRAIGRWSFPMQDLGGPAQVTYPFVLSPPAAPDED